VRQLRAEAALAGIARGRVMGGVLIRHVLPVLVAPIAGECPVPRLLCCYVTGGTTAKKCAWGY
jgi:hypothetical protein